MIIATQDQARARFATLPSPLQDAIFSVQNSEIIAGITEDNNLNDDQASKLAEIVGWVFLGFIHPEDVTKELQEKAAIPAPTAITLTDSLKVKLFNPLKMDLEKAYAPMPGEEIGIPKIIQEIKAPAPPQKSAPGPQIISQTFSANPNLGSAPLASNKNVAAPAPQPKSMNDVGWSRRATPQEPTIKLGTIASKIPVPVRTFPPSTQPASIPKPPVPPPTKSMSEFDRLGLTAAQVVRKPAPMPATPTPPRPVAPAPVPTKPSEPAPMILHQQAAMPTQNTPNFQLKTPVKNQISGIPPQTAGPAKPAVLEFNDVSAPKAIHYTEYKPPAPPTPSPNGAPRQITEVTNQPPKPPSPPAGPQPSQPQQSPQGKIIVKDFL